MASHNKSSGKSKSSGLRILWIPGKRKSHPKGRYDATNKTHTPLGGQKRNEIWSLGGSKAQRDLLQADSEVKLFEGPSGSSVASTACALGAIGATECALTNNTSSTQATEEHKPSKIEAIASDTAASSNSTIYPSVSADVNITTTQGAIASDIITTTIINMPAKTTATTTADMETNRFTILDNGISHDLDVHDLPLPPKNGINGLSKENSLLNNSTETTMSTATIPSPNRTPKQSDDTGSHSGSPKKKKNRHKHDNNNHENDINSIESISDPNKIPISDLDWIDGLHNTKPMSSKKKKDQLDGVPTKLNHKEKHIDEDEKVVSCLYYTLMCCECTIS